MARTNNLTNFLNDVATAIKQKTGDNTPIPASEFDTKIGEIETGGTYQSKTINISANGSQTVTPDTGYDALSQVNLSVNVDTSIKKWVDWEESISLDSCNFVQTLSDSTAVKLNTSEMRVDGSNDWIYRAYLRFDLNRLILNSERYEIDKAELRFEMNWKNDNGTSSVYGWTTPNDAYNPTTLNWNNQPSLASIPTSQQYSMSGKVVGDWCTLGVTSLVKSWMNGTPNYGIVLKAINEGSYRRDWKMYAIAPNNLTVRPYLYIVGKKQIVENDDDLLLSNKILNSATQDYKFLEYIESDGTSWIDTNYFANKNTSVDLQGMYLSTDANWRQFLGGAASYHIDTGIQIAYNGDLGKVAIDYSTAGSTDGPSVNLNTVFTAHISSEYMQVNDTVFYKKAEFNPTERSSVPLYIFNDRRTSNVELGAIGRIYYVKIYESGNLVRDFVPAIKIANQEVGMYDNVSHTFFTNQGFNSFIAGPIIEI